MNCLNHHTANNKGCRVYQALRRKILPESINQKHQNFRINTKDFPQINSQTYTKLVGDNNNFNKVQYSDVLKQDDTNNRMKNIENMFGQLINMLTLLISKLCN